MSNTIYSVKHYYQPSNTSCGPTALAIILSYYNQQRSPESIIKEVPVIRNKKGEDCGTSGQEIATWCLWQRFDVDLYSADFQLLDLSWSHLNRKQLLERLSEAAKVRNVQALGKTWSRLYLQTYIKFLNAGGNLHIRPYIGSELLDKLLRNGPVVVTVNYNVLYNTGRSRNVGLRKSQDDDTHGELTDHFVVLYGKQNFDYLIDDPYRAPGQQVIEPERLIAAISSAQILCDNLVFQLSEKS